MKTIAVIPARGGSKRIPQKNIMDFMGKPLIAWTVEAAQESGVFDRIVVSTDDKETARIVEKLGVEVPFFREEATDDQSPVSIATIAAIKQAQAHWHEEYEVVVQLMANCPLRGSKEIVNSYNNFMRGNAPFQLSCFKFGWMNPWWAMRLDDQQRHEFLFPEALKMRSQDLADLFCPTGAIWIARISQLLVDKTFYGNGHMFFPIDWKSAVDIDNYEDVDFAKAVFSIIPKDNR